MDNKLENNNPKNLIPNLKISDFKHKLEKVDKFDKVDIEELIAGLKITEQKALEKYLNEIWKVNIILN
jgi:hypothetical protein